MVFTVFACCEEEWDIVFGWNYYAHILCGLNESQQQSHRQNTAWNLSTVSWEICLETRRGAQVTSMYHNLPWPFSRYLTSFTMGVEPNL